MLRFTKTLSNPIIIDGQMNEPITGLCIQYYVVGRLWFEFNTSQRTHIR